MSESKIMEAVDTDELRDLRRKARISEYGHNPVLLAIDLQQRTYRNFREELAQMKYEHPTSMVIGHKGSSEFYIEYRLFRKPKIIIKEGGEDIGIS